MRILYLNPSSQLGGAERSLIDVIGSIKNAQPDWDLHVVVTDHGPLIEKAAAAGATVTVVEFAAAIAKLGDAAVRGPAGDRITRATLLRRLLAAGPATLRYIFKLRKAIRAIRPDVVHTNGFKMHILGVWAARGLAPVVWHIHDYVSVRPVMSRLLRQHRSRCAALIANSDSVLADVKATLGADAPVQRVYNAVDVETFSPEGPVADLDALAGMSPPRPGTVRVGLVATLGRWKGHAVFLRALAKLDRSLPVRGYVVGGALYQTGGSQYSIKDLKKLADSLGIGGQVGFTGFVDEPAEAIRALDIVVHASTQPEPFGLVIIEAMGLCARSRGE
jgi:glycosyltransferase involved in cell wall biosynthesis